MSLIIPVGLSARGVFHVQKRNSRSGIVTDEREVPNMLLKGWTDLAFNRGLLGLVVYASGSVTNIAYCALGDNNTPPVYTDLGGIKGNILGAESGNSVNRSLCNTGEYPVWEKVTYKFVAGKATGVIREIAIQSTNAIGTGYARVVIDPPIVKTETDEVIVTYIRYLYRSADVFEGVIPKGQSDGVTDISWKATINNIQLRSILSGYTLRCLRDTNYSLYFTTGTSNLPSDVFNDTDTTIKGTKISSYIPNFLDLLTQVPGTNYGDFRFGFETTATNGNIGELVLERIARITFDPPLIKTNNRRLYLTLRLSFAP